MRCLILLLFISTATAQVGLQPNDEIQHIPTKYDWRTHLLKGGSDHGWSGKEKPAIGRVLYVEGKAYWSGLPYIKEVKKGDYLRVNMFLATEKNSYVKILMDNNTLIDIGESSQLFWKVDQSRPYTFDALEYHFLYGKLRILNTNRTNKDAFLLITPTLGSLIKDNEVFVDVWFDRKKWNTQLAVLSNSVLLDLSRTALKEKKIRLKRGYAFRTNYNKPGKYNRGHVLKLDQKTLERLEKKSNVRLNIVKHFLFEEVYPGQEFPHPHDSRIKLSEFKTHPRPSEKRYVPWIVRWNSHNQSELLYQTIRKRKQKHSFFPYPHYLEGKKPAEYRVANKQYIKDERLRLIRENIDYNKKEYFYHRQQNELRKRSELKRLNCQDEKSCIEYGY